MKDYCGDGTLLELDFYGNIFAYMLNNYTVLNNPLHTHRHNQSTSKSGEN